MMRLNARSCYVEVLTNPGVALIQVLTMHLFPRNLGEGSENGRGLFHSDQIT